MILRRSHRELGRENVFKRLMTRRKHQSCFPHVVACLPVLGLTVEGDLKARALGRGWVALLGP